MIQAGVRRSPRWSTFGRRGCLTLLSLLLALLVASCRTATPTPTMSLEEAKQVTASFAGLGFVPPPRTITDLEVLLQGSGTEDARMMADMEIPDYTREYWREEAGRLYWTRGKAARRVGRFAQAIRDFTRAAELVTPEMMIAEGGLRSGTFAASAPHSEWGNLGMSILRELAQTEAEAGNYRRAIDLFRQAEAGSVRGDRRAFPIYTGSDLVDLYSTLGDVKAVERLVMYLRGLHFELLRQENPRDPIPMARRAYWESNVAAAQATLMEMRGRFAEAERLWRASIEVVRPYQGNEWVTERFDARTGRLALCLMRQGRLLEAETEARGALRSALGRPGTHTYGTVALLTTLGRVLREQGRYAEAERIARGAIGWYERGGASPASSLALSGPRRDLASALASQGRWDPAIEQYGILREQLQDDGLYRRLTEGDPTLAIALVRTGRIEDAARIVSTGLEHSRRIRGEQHATTAEWRALYAMVLARRGESGRALQEFSSAAGVLLDRTIHVDEEATSRGERDERLRWILSEYVDLLARSRAMVGIPGGLDPVAESFRLADVARSRFVQRALDATGARSAVKTPNLADLVRREQDAAKQIGALHGLLTTVLTESSGRGSASELREQISKLQQARRALTQQISNEFPAYAQLVNPPPITAEQARGALRPDEALIVTLVADDRTYVWALSTSGRVAFSSVPAGGKVLEEKIDRLRRALDPRIRMVGDIPDFDLAMAHELYRALLEPVRAGWEGAQSLLIVAHGPLGQLPFQVLPTERVRLGAEGAPLFGRYRSVPWLARRHAITTVPSVGALVTLRRGASGPAERKPFVGFGDPYFTAAQAMEASREPAAADVAGRVSREASSRSVPLALRDVLVSPAADVETSKLGMLPRLPDTAEEIRAIARVTKADLSSDVFLGLAANERTVKTLDLTQYRVVAFATHGLVPGDLDGLTQPALALTAPEVAKIDGDGLLTMEEILALRLDADWVVLSACNTANGAGAGAEAVSGLGRAFFYAGARALLVTHWPVETTSARALTTGLFKRYAGEPGVSRAKALQQTMNALIDDGGLIDPQTGKMVFSYAHPIFWAPFALVGDGG